MKAISIEQAEKIAGKRLDRRRKYFTNDDGKPDPEDGIYPGESLFCYTEWTETCSGCHDTIDGYEIGPYPRDKNGIPIGSGCHECGYTGKRRIGWFYPASANEEDKKCRKQE
jgi:hypothetical protein